MTSSQQIDRGKAYSQTYGHTSGQASADTFPDRVHVTGCVPLRGTMMVAGAKNAVLPIMAASILTDHEVILHRVPLLSDIEHMGRAMRDAGYVIERSSIERSSPTTETFQWRPTNDSSANGGSANGGSAFNGMRDLSPSLSQSHKTNQPNAKPLDASLSGNIDLYIRRDGAQRDVSDGELALKDGGMFTVGDHAKKIRASILLVGPLLSRRCSVTIPFPGGDPIGRRPIDFHLSALTSMGAHCHVTNSEVVVRPPQNGLHGATIAFPFPSVGATENVMMAAVLAHGTTVIRGAACEPEIVDLAHFLRAGGAHIEGDGTSEIVIHGVEALSVIEHTVIPDRIETISYMVLSALHGGHIKICGAPSEMIGQATLDFFNAVGVNLTEHPSPIDGYSNWIIEVGSNSLRPAALQTSPFPGIATDVQAQLTVLLSRAVGVSSIMETVFEDRYGHLEGLRSMGAHVDVQQGVANVTGPVSYRAAHVCARDIRSSFALLSAATIAQGVSVVEGMSHLYRGYAELLPKLNLLGAQIKPAPDHHP